jgi:hypothetical protein
MQKDMRGLQSSEYGQRTDRDGMRDKGDIRIIKINWQRDHSRYQNDEKDREKR